jgi:hypothetical protein
MADSVVGVYNRALSQAGITEFVASPSEASLPAQVCNLWYDTARGAVLRSAPWQSARKTRRLALVSTRDGAWLPGQAPDPYRFAYGVPTDMLAPYHLESYFPFTFRDNDAGTSLLCTNDPDPLLYYNFDQTNVQRWDEGLHLAVVMTLAVFISTPLSASSVRARENEARALELVEQAQVFAANTQDQLEESVPPELLAAGYLNPTSTPRYVYPYQMLRIGALGLQ